jgi:4-hydroxybenzoate polyprenyltransferase
VSFLINQYSFVIISLLLLISAGFLLLRRQPKLKNYLAFCVIIIGIIAAWMIIHPRQTPFMNNAQAVQKLIGAGKPVLLEFQSPY